MAESVETLGVDLRTRVKRLAVKEKARRKKCKVRFSLVKKNEAFQKNYMRVGSRSCYERVWHQRERGAHAVGMAPHRLIKIEEADGSSSGQKERDLDGSIWP